MYVKDKLTKISGGFVIGLSILVTFLTMMEGAFTEHISNFVLYLVFAIAIFISSANRKEGEGKTFCRITVISSILVVVFSIIQLLFSDHSSLVAHSITSVFFLVIMPGTVISLLSAFLSVISNTLSSDGMVNTLKRLVVVLTFSFIVYFILCIFFPILSTTPFTYLVVIGQVIILVATLFVLVLDKIHTFEEISNLTSKYREQVDIIQKLREVEEQTNKEKEELLQQISKLEKVSSAMEKPNYPQQPSANVYSQSQTSSLQSEPAFNGGYSQSSDTVVVEVPRIGTESLESSVSPNPNPTLVEQTSVVSVSDTSSSTTNPIPQLKL